MMQIRGKQVKTQQDLKKNLLTKLEEVKIGSNGSPVTDLDVTETVAQEIETLTAAMEAANPNLYPLRHSPLLLQGSWQLLYSTAREIRRLAALPLGLKVGRVYQDIDLANKAFYNQAYVEHPFGLVGGYVKVTATFEADCSVSPPLPDKRINVFFQQRYLAITQILGLKTPKLDPYKVVPAQNPEGRIPYLDITYLDDSLRIGRGGAGSLFILRKSQ